MMKGKTVALIGATGLIGGHILQCLLEDENFTSIKVIVRRPLTLSHPKISVKIIDFDDESAYKEAITGCDAVFCAIGTTSKKVKGDKTAYRKVDFDIPVNAARFCSESGCRKFLLVSSVGASSKSGNFYLKLKGEVEDKIRLISLSSVSIFRPSMLLGHRTESRPLETISQAISKPLSFLFPSQYKPIAAMDVAKAMTTACKQDRPGVNIYHFREMISLLK